ncbi:redox-regulated ATPase YchF [Candidatus Woesearchaeota archaeon]|nr:redox-regulated ATPase YchF [Candidatus Woesearchaeota archaeon]
MLVGVVGKPNCGKSTFFKALTLAEVEIANYPFTTITANEGVAYVKIECVDKEFNATCKPKFGYCVNGARFIPVKILDVAGLVPGAHLGKGRGNAFLDDLRQADVLIHIIDASGSTNAQGEPVDALSYDPAEDIKFLEVELDMWYLGILKKPWERFAKTVNQEKLDVDKAVAKQFSGLGADENMIKDLIKKLGLNEKLITDWSDDDLKNFAVELRKLTKPIIIAANKVDVPGAEKNLERLKKEFPDYIIVPCSAESELALKEASKHGLIKYVSGENGFEMQQPEKLNEKQKTGLEFVRTNVLSKFKSTGVEEVLDDAVFKLLRFIAVYPVANSKLEDKDGNKLPDCFLVPEGTTALEFAYKVHSDLGDNFIKAVDLKTKQIIGKEHELKHRDVIEIVTSK